MSLKIHQVGVSLSAAIASLALLTTPAFALTDTNLDAVGIRGTATLADQEIVSTGGTMPDNPSQPLPDSVSDEIADDATVVSEDLAMDEDGTVRDIESGTVITGPDLVGTTDTQADPLAKTDGESFIPVSAAEVREAVDDSDTVEQSAARSSAAMGTQGTVRTVALDNNIYGAYWGTYSNAPAFFEADDTLFAQHAKGVVDVSEWQGTIDWAAAKADGVEGAIIRLAYGWGNGFDADAVRNINECKRLGIPFGIYVYSYAYDAACGSAEGANTVSLLQQAGVSPNDLSYPVYYDLENWTWTGHTPPTSPAVYDGIVNAWYAQLQSAGYTNLSVYSYTSYLNSALNSANIRSKTRWVASYGARTNFGYSSNDRGWQYTSSGTVNGITGNVDLNAFGVKDWPGNDGSATPPVSDPGQDGEPAPVITCNDTAVYRVYNRNSGLHHYTTSDAERVQLVAAGWSDEGTAFCAVGSGDDGTSVYRLYNPNDGNHMYTIDGKERRDLINAGWNNEGVGWQIPADGNVPVYRLYNPGSGEHIYTTNFAEYQRVGTAGWHQEGIAWYSL